MSILTRKPATEDTSSLDALIAERAALMGALENLEQQDAIDREKASMAGLGMTFTEGGTPVGASQQARGLYLSEESRQLINERNAADVRRRRRQPELQAAREKVSRLDSAIRHALTARLAVEAAPPQATVIEALMSAYRALDTLAQRRAALADEYGVPLAESDYETTLRQALGTCCGVVGMAAPESTPSRRGRADFLELAGAAKKRDRRLADLQDELLRPPAVIEAMTRRGDIAAQKEREAAGERRQQEADRARQTTLPKGEADRRRKLREQIAETEKGSTK